MGKKRGNNEGTIYRRKDGTWCAQITVGRDPDTGKPKRVTFYGKTRQEVAEKLARALNDVKQGTFMEPSRLTVGEWLDIWLNDYKRLDLRPTTWESYEVMVRCHLKPAIGHLALRDLRPEHLQHLYNEKLKAGLSARTVRYIHHVIHCALNQAKENGLVVRNVSEATKLPALKKREIRALTLEEQQRFLEVLEQDRLGVAFKVLLGTGMRRGELLGLKWQDVDLEEATIRVRQQLTPVKGKAIYQEPKTEKARRVIPLPRDVVLALKAHKARQAKEKLLAGPSYQDNGLVFCTEIGTPINPRNFNRKFYELRKKAGLGEDVNLHALRHTYATRLLELGEDLKVVQELLGHSRIAVTADTYAHVSPKLKRDAVAKLDGMLTPKKTPSA
ncbi:MAG: site-specific integrase [Syntrophothermus sp.]|uniref:tyrosine-type recombinase/integrase n=1 Tax=Syntrophothermus sp. TaxID=2736299 RepID=UPI00257E3B04|nr:site-specific integrase [Syntrophothermus sp.]NSW83570.1 site-specific integrase [Syntrophothermus sp.]